MTSIIEQLQADFDGWGTVHDADGLVKLVGSNLGTKGFTAESSRIVFSVCPDDINRLHERRTIEGALAGVYNGDFHLGTLAAYPIGGVTGIAAASHHAPERHIKGVCVEGDLIFFASPHMGIVPGANLAYGKLTRPGQEHETSCCGAMMGFLKALKSAKSCSNIELDLDDPLDIARQTVFCELAKRHGRELDEIRRIQDENKQIIELAKVNHDLVEGAIKRMLHAFVSKDKCQNRYALVSGITINAPGEDFFVLKGISILKE
nr:hypothetical protein [Candidatus Sigynarchaeum springense]